MYCKGLTKQELIEAGIVDVKRDFSGWHVYRYWFKNNGKVKELNEIKITLANRKHKYRPDKQYPKVTFCMKQARYNIPLSRLIYVWYKEDIPDGMVIDHIDNDPYNNSPSNLQMLTVGENLSKRFEDNPDAWTNQWGHTKNY